MCGISYKETIILYKDSIYPVYFCWVFIKTSTAAVYSECLPKGSFKHTQNCKSICHVKTFYVDIVSHALGRLQLKYMYYPYSELCWWQYYNYYVPYY